ncbi:hypothetical protein CDAR_573761 [Caerostris darwini]|uniref:Uncharacterized protein n=1 Tax=Caerostris darwini TaxID=1538125 RepID=A0AAV4MCE8_9ARAC|nr:hypothetical protein CDAR_573761 [Caerostris darwini]
MFCFESLPTLVWNIQRASVKRRSLDRGLSCQPEYDPTHLGNLVSDGSYLSLTIGFPAKSHQYDSLERQEVSTCFFFYQYSINKDGRKQDTPFEVTADSNRNIDKKRSYVFKKLIKAL